MSLPWCVILRSVDYLVVLLLGSLVGFGEIVSRYRDAPWKAVLNWSAMAYVAVNAIAAVSALALVKIFGATFGQTDPGKIRAMRILVAGFGAMALFRTSLFVFRVGDRDIGVGPMTLLQLLLSAMDRAVDRRRAVGRASEVTKALGGLSFTQVRDALPRYCLTLMQNVSKEEEAELRKEIEAISHETMEDAVKVNALGLALMNIVGQDVLLAAVDALKSRMIEKGVLGEVYPRLLQALRGRQEPGAKTLDVLGLTLYTAWPNLRAWIDDRASPVREWTVVLRVLNPAMSPDFCDSWLDDRWISEAQGVIDEIQAYVADNRTQLDDQQVTIVLRLYSFAPAFHGFRLDDGSYFISFVHWDDKTRKIARPHQTYEHVPPEDSSARATHLRQLFDNWLARIDEASTERAISSAADGSRP